MEFTLIDRVMLLNYCGGDFMNNRWEKVGNMAAKSNMAAGILKNVFLRQRGQGHRDHALLYGRYCLWSGIRIRVI